MKCESINNPPPPRRVKWNQMDYKLRHLSYSWRSVYRLTLLLFQPRGCRPSWWRTRGAWGPTWGRDTHRPTWCLAPTWGSTTRTSRTSPRCWPPGTPTDSTCSPCRCPMRWVAMTISENQWNESSTVRTDRKSNILSHEAANPIFLACIPLSLKAASRAWYEPLLPSAVWRPLNSLNN